MLPELVVYGALCAEEWERLVRQLPPPPKLTEQRFAVLLERVTTQEDVLTIARNMQRTIAHPVTLDHHELLLSSRIGISLSGKDGLDAQGLIAAAVQALDGMQGEGSRVSGMNGAPDAPVADSRSTIAA